MKGNPSDLFHFASTDSTLWVECIMTAASNEKDFQSKKRRKPTDQMWLDVATKAAQRYHQLFGERVFGGETVGWRDAFSMAAVRETAKRLQEHYAAQAREEMRGSA